METNKRENHDHLANFIRDTHANLRRRCLEGKDPETVWSEHVKDGKILAEYAHAMSSLAVEHWATRKETRIEWCHEFLKQYFSENGMLKRFLEKDRRTLEYHSKGLDDADIHRCCGYYFDTDDEFKQHVDDTIERFNKRSEQNEIHIPILQPIQLLDVGSCYAPFKKYPEYKCLAIDLCPANEDVVKCDFLNVKIENDKTGPVIDDTEVVKTLPSQYYHGVVFSLLLEYLPSPVLRWKCCINAHKLLKLNGTLVIITPDSNKQHRNAPQMSDWKDALESIGFQRCSYVKQEHLHCMAFRKTMNITDYSQVLDKSSLLHIPQDFNTKVSSEVKEAHAATTSDNDEPEAKKLKTSDN